MRITMHIEKKLWDDMRQTMGTISMPLVAHQQVQQLLNQVEQSAKDLLEGHDIKVNPNGAHPIPGD
jgi:hypothetical protein